MSKSQPCAGASLSGFTFRADVCVVAKAVDYKGDTNIDPITLNCGSTPAITINPGSATYCKTTANICWADQPVIPNYQWYYSHGTYEVNLTGGK